MYASQRDVAPLITRHRRAVVLRVGHAVKLAGFFFTGQTTWQIAAARFVAQDSIT